MGVQIQLPFLFSLPFHCLRVQLTAVQSLISMQSCTQPPSRRLGTRASNSTKHPGLPDAPAKRRTPTEKMADDAHLLELQATKDANAILTLDNLASVEEAMEASQAAKRTASKKGVRPPMKRSVKEGVTAADIPKGRQSPH